MQDNYDYLDQEVQQQVNELKAAVPALKKVLDMIPSRSEPTLDAFYEQLASLEKNAKFILESLTSAGVVNIRKEGDTFFISLTTKGELVKTKS